MESNCSMYIRILIMRILIWMVGTALRMRDDVFCVSSIGGWSRVRIHKVGRHRTHPAWRAHNTAFAYSQTWRVRWCMRMRKRKVWLNLRICNWMVAHAQLDQCRRLLRIFNRRVEPNAYTQSRSTPYASRMACTQSGSTRKRKASLKLRIYRHLVVGG